MSFSFSPKCILKRPESTKVARVPLKFRDLGKVLFVPGVTPHQGIYEFKPKLSAEEHRLVQGEVNKLMVKQAIMPVADQPGQLLGHLFLCQKKDGSQRPIFNLKKLNRSIQNGRAIDADRLVDNRGLDGQSGPEGLVFLPLNAHRGWTIPQVLVKQADI